MAGRKICVMTGGRADYGLLHWPMHKIAISADFAAKAQRRGNKVVVNPHGSGDASRHIVLTRKRFFDLSKESAQCAEAF